MPEEAMQQLQSIQSMLAAGHRSVRLDRHSLVIWGITGGLACALTEMVITHERFPTAWQQAVALMVWLGAGLGLAGVLDWRLTRRRARESAETVSFVQIQVTKAWWMLMGLGMLFSFATFFFGGGAMVYCVWLILFGAGFYIHGLFSRRIVEWMGLCTALIGVAALTSKMDYGTTRWLAASTLGIGLPLVSLMLRVPDEVSLPRNVGRLAVWLLLVVAPPLSAMHYLGSARAPTAAPVAWQAFNPAVAGEQVVRLPVGSTIQLKLDMDSEILGTSPEAALPMTLSQPVEVALVDGRPDGRFRIGNSAWHNVGRGVLRLNITRIEPALGPDTGPTVTARSSLRFNQHSAEAKHDR